VGIYLFKATTRRAMVFLCAFGAIAQSLRLIAKTPLHFKGIEFQAIWIAELFIFFIFAGLFLLLHRKRFRIAFDTFIKDFEEHMARQEFSKIKQRDKYFAWDDPLIKD
jgi:hypothetical protein